MYQKMIYIMHYKKLIMIKDMHKIDIKKCLIYYYFIITDVRVCSHELQYYFIINEYVAQTSPCNIVM